MPCTAKRWLGFGFITLLTLLAAGGGVWSEVLAASNEQEVDFKGGFAHASWEINESNGTKGAAEVWLFRTASSPDKVDRPVGIIGGLRYNSDLTRVDAISGINPLTAPGKWPNPKRTQWISGTWSAPVERRTLTVNPNGGRTWDRQVVPARVELSLTAEGRRTEGALKASQSSFWRQSRTLVSGTWASSGGEGGISLQNQQAVETFVQSKSAIADGEIGFPRKGHSWVSSVVQQQ